MRVLTQSVTVSLLFAAPVAAQTYEPVLVAPQIVGTPTTMTPLRLGDDNTAQVDLGFEFTYWDQTFTSAWVSSNGFVSFQGPANLCCNGQPLEQAQRNTIYGFWTDLVSSTGNPYYQRGEGSILFGWYDTQEYGTQNRLTFEIGLASDNSIRFNFGDLSSLTYHWATAGITGPNAGDNIQLFYGRDTQFLRNQSGILSWLAPTLVVAVDCNVTPMDPSCPPAAINVTPEPAVNVAEAVADAVEQIVALEPEEMEQVLETAVAALAQAEEAATSVTERVAELIAAERLSPDQVAALAATPAAASAQGFDSLSMGPVNPDVAAFSTATGLPQAAFGAAQTGANPATFTAGFETVASTSGPSSVANTLETLGMSSAPSPQVSLAQSDQQTGNAMAEGQSETMAAIAAVPGFAAYTQVALQDRPDFYAVRDIYRNRRLRDANFEMYRMMNTNDAKWREMVNEQY